MAADVTLLAQERQRPSIKVQVLFYPVTNVNYDTSSYLKYQEVYWLTRKAMMWFWDSYTTNQTNRKDPKVSPLQATLEQLKGLPPALSLKK
jgi:acetyl esterase